MHFDKRGQLAVPLPSDPLLLCWLLNLRSQEKRQGETERGKHKLLLW